MFINMYVGSKTLIIFRIQIPLPYKNQQNTTAAFRIRILWTLDAVCCVLYFEKKNKGRADSKQFTCSGNILPEQNTNIATPALCMETMLLIFFVFFCLVSAYGQ